MTESIKNETIGKVAQKLIDEYKEILDKGWSTKVEYLDAKSKLNGLVIFLGKLMLEGGQE